MRKKEIENELTVTSVSSKDDIVILDLKFTEPRSKEPTEQQLQKAIEPLPTSQMEKAGRDVAKGYFDVVQRQMQTTTQSLAQILPPTLPPNTIRITLSKQEYVELGRPAVFDKLTLKLSMKTAP